MIVTWMLYALLVSALVAGAAVGLETVFRLAGAPLRWVWAGALVLTLALVALAPGRRPAPPVQLPKVAMVEAMMTGTLEAPAPSWRERLPTLGSGAVRELRDALTAAGRRAPESTGRYLLLLWAGGSVLVLAAIGGTHQRFRRQRSRWPAAEVQGIRVRVSPRVGPVVMGVARPEIVIPRWLLDLSVTESRLVLTHESEHVRARDPLVLALAWTVAALLAWNPAVWWMVARLRLAVELDCDARVLRRGESAHSYGSVLIDLAGRSTPMRAGMLALADPPSQLERRLLAMTYQRTRTALARGCALGSLALAALLAACAAELPTAAEIQAIDVASAEAAGNRVSLLDGAENTVYKLDGVIVTREDALALTPDKIASVGVVKARTPGGQSEIAIVSKTSDARRVDVLRGDSVSFRTRSVSPQAGPEPVYLVDGVRQAKAPMGDLAPSSIESIHVIKDRDAAVKLAGPDAVNGLVVIRTKGGKPDGLDLDGAGAEAQMRIRGVVPTPGESRVTVRGAETQMRIRGVAPTPGESRVSVRGLVPGGPEPLYIVDGVPRTGTTSGSPLEDLDPATIESISVLKDRSATEAYGSRGVNGVVIITTRKTPAP